MAFEQRLALVERPGVDVGWMAREPADLRDQHREARIALEEVLDREVERARLRVFLANLGPIADHKARAGALGRGAGIERAVIGRSIEGVEPAPALLETIVTHGAPSITSTACSTAA